MLSKIATLVSVVAAQQQPFDAEPVKCRVLSLSGGGAKGAYEAGALHSIINELEPPHN